MQTKGFFIPLPTKLGRVYWRRLGCPAAVRLSAFRFLSISLKPGILEPMCCSILAETHGGCPLYCVHRSLRFPFWSLKTFTYLNSRPSAIINLISGVDSFPLQISDLFHIAHSYRLGGV